jgi:2-polyprenyl-3-methyl-5-hydroxy-6-metoxy-1,4-benzoquinol methylase
MDTAEYHKMHRLERHYWWFQGRREVILTLLRDALQRVPSTNGKSLRILDVGCGTGLLLDDLRQMGTAVGLDFSPVALKYCKDRHLGDLGRANVENLPVRDAAVEVVTALDLIEHVRDDHQLAREIARVLHPGGIAVMSVPAHKVLWSTHDVALHHFRRYEKAEFRSLIETAGLEPVKFTYAVSTAYFPAMLYRRVRTAMLGKRAPVRTDEFPLPKPLNSLLRASMAMEARWLRHRNLPFGLSLMCIARKP